jgi:phosphonate C-P lyase system protein PhnG
MIESAKEASGYTESANKETLETRFRRYLPDLKPAAVREMLEVVVRNPLRVVKEPSTGLIMIDVNDCFDTPFHLGEVLVTHAEVEYKGMRGHATVMGHEPEKAVLAASVSAIMQIEDESILDDLWSLIIHYAKEIDADREKEATLAAATRVAFENMAKEQ